MTRNKLLQHLRAIALGSRDSIDAVLDEFERLCRELADFECPYDITPITGIEAGLVRGPFVPLIVSDVMTRETFKTAAQALKDSVEPQIESDAMIFERASVRQTDRELRAWQMRLLADCDRQEREMLKLGARALRQDIERQIESDVMTDGSSQKPHRSRQKGYPHVRHPETRGRRRHRNRRAQSKRAQHDHS